MVIYEYKNGELIESGLKMEDYWNQDEKFEDFLKNIGFNKDNTKIVGIDGFFAFTIYGSLQDEARYFIDFCNYIDVYNDIMYILIEGQHNFLKFCKEYTQYIENYLAIENIKQCRD